MTVFTLTFAVLALAAAGAQAPLIVAAPPLLPPATRLEGFSPSPGTLMTIGYDRIGGTAAEMLKLRSLFDAAEQKLRSVLAGR